MPRYTPITLLLLTALALLPYCSRADDAGARPECPTCDAISGADVDLDAELAVAARLPLRIYATGAQTGGDLRLIQRGELVEKLARARCVFVGEQHGQSGCHLVQYWLLAELHKARAGRLALAMEQFERPAQPHLDAFMRGAISEDAMLRSAEPWPNYPQDYRRLVLYAKQRNIYLCAGNVWRPLASRIARQGFGAAWAGYSGEERAWVAASTGAYRDLYWDHFAAAMGIGAGGDGVHGMTEESAWPIYQAQCVKDDTMAESIARILLANPGYAVLHTNGSFHSDYRGGVPLRLLTRMYSSDALHPLATDDPGLLGAMQAEGLSGGDPLFLTVTVVPVDSLSAAALNAAELNDEPPADFVIYVYREREPGEPLDSDPLLLVNQTRTEASPSAGAE